ncbi:DUF6086 family protein [Streptomyces sp. NPDC055632]
MGYPFETIDRSRNLWGPALRVGQTYVALAREFGTLNGIPTGLTENEQLGGSTVDPVIFQKFTQALYDRYCSTNNQVLHGLLRGLLLASLVMLEKCGSSIARTPEREEGVMEELAAYERFMWTD